MESLLLKKIVKKMVVNEVRNILLEQDPPPESEPSADTSAPKDEPADELSDLDSVLSDEGEGGGAEAPAGGDTAAGLDIGGDTAPEGEGETDTELTDEEGDLDMPGGGGGFSGGGGSFGGDTGPSGEGDKETEEETPEEGSEESEEDLLPEDPVQSTVDGAIDMLKVTGDDQEILNFVKASIQQNFSNFEEAAPVIYELWQTGQPTLLQVARKLLQFLKGI